MSNAGRIAGIAGLFDDPAELLAAAEKVREAGFRNFDCHTPFPVHGLDRAMGVKDSPIGAIGLFGGLAGLLLAVLMQWWMSVVDYPVLIGGKPLFSWPAFVPICFELFVLFAAVTTMAAMLSFCRLGRWRSPLHDSGIMAEITSHRFAVVLDAKDRLFTADGAADLLRRAGCGDVRTLIACDEEDESVP